MKKFKLYLLDYYPEPHYNIVIWGNNCLSITSDTSKINIEVLIVNLKAFFGDFPFKLTMGFNVSFKTHIFIYQQGFDSLSEEQWLKPFQSKRKGGTKTTKRKPKENGSKA